MLALAKSARILQQQQLFFATHERTAGLPLLVEVGLPLRWQLCTRTPQLNRLQVGKRSSLSRRTTLPFKRCAACSITWPLQQTRVPVSGTETQPERVSCILRDFGDDVASLGLTTVEAAKDPRFY